MSLGGEGTADPQEALETGVCSGRRLLIGPPQRRQPQERARGRRGSMAYHGPINAEISQNYQVFKCFLNVDFFQNM